MSKKTELSEKRAALNEEINAYQKRIDDLKQKLESEPNNVDLSKQLNVAITAQNNLQEDVNLLEAVNDKKINRQRLRFTKNKLSSGFALLAIVFNALYFASIYRSVEANVGTEFYYRFMIGASVVANLLFMLVSFLSSEGVKNYKLSYSIVLIALGVFQICRIFYLPLNASRAEFIHVVDSVEVVSHIMETSQFIRVTLCLVASAALLIAGGIIGIMKSLTLKSVMKETESDKAEGVA